MSVIEKFIAGAFGLIVLYLLFNSQNVAEVLSSLGGATSGVFGTLQGRDVSGLGGVSITTGGRY